MNSSNPTLSKHKGKILWLASYPKSGNTWFRSFLSALFLNGKINLQNLLLDNHFADRSVFSELTHIDSSFLSRMEIAKYLPKLIDYYAHFVDGDRMKLVKIHDCAPQAPYEYISTTNTVAVIYLIRNPLSIAASFASHMSSTIDYAIKVMNDASYGLARQLNGLHKKAQFEQPMGTWSQHVQSWLNYQKAQVIPVRYEDLKRTPYQTFSKVIQQLNLDFSEDEIKRAIEASSFNKLQLLEKEDGFDEKPISAKQFFRKGEIDAWRNELNQAQQAQIVKDHRIVMEQFGYL
ncbi:MAG: sulfotransferase domain-containing protein [Flammeovirgaceae bacterium]